MRFRLTPQDETFLALFGRQAALLVEGADLLAELLGRDAAGRIQVAADLSGVEHRADEVGHEVVRRLNSAFVTPFDRQDIHQLSLRLDECLDRMEAAADLMVLHRVGALPPGTVDLVAVLQRQAELTVHAVPRLRSMKDLPDYWVEVNRLHNQAERTRRVLVAGLLAGPDLAVALRVRDVVEELAGAARAFEQVAHTVEAIAVKES